jgi:signal transduction histidine kinase
VGTLQRETSRLAQLTTDFLDMARLESGRTRFRFESFQLADLIEECIGIVRPQAAERGLQVATHVPAGLPTVESDRDKVKQVMLNLLTNAVKYNRPDGSITVEVTTNPGRVRISVADTGKGIPAEAATRLFEKFYRAPDSYRYATGTGLGLPIAKRIVEALGGDIGLLSPGAEGSTFYFDLPLAAKPPGPSTGG